MNTQTTPRAVNHSLPRPKAHRSSCSVWRRLLDHYTQFKIIMNKYTVFNGNECIKEIFVFLPLALFTITNQGSWMSTGFSFSLVRCFFLAAVSSVLSSGCLLTHAWWLDLQQCPTPSSPALWLCRRHSRIGPTMIQTGSICLLLGGRIRDSDKSEPCESSHSVLTQKHLWTSYVQTDEAVYKATTTSLIMLSYSGTVRNL